MKRLVIAALAIGAMAACTKSNVQYEQPGEISLQPVTQKATKAAVDGTHYPTGIAYNFNVWAWWGDYAAATPLESFTTTTPYIANGTFVHRTETANSWGGQTPYYWPTKGSLVFAGYSPASATGTFNFDFANKAFTATNYIQSNNIAQTKDLMWFDITEKSYNDNANKNTQNQDVNGVPVVFQHALSWLTFKFKLAEGVTQQNWTITNVKLTGIETTADFNSTSGWTNARSPQEVGVWSSASDSVDPYVVRSDEKVLESTTNGVVVIPQSCAPETPAVDATPAVPAAAELVITYNMKTYVGEGVLTGQEVRLPLNGSQITGDKWLPGNHYTYTITFGANEIRIAPTVSDWEKVEVDNIPVQ